MSESLLSPLSGHYLAATRTHLERSERISGRLLQESRRLEQQFKDLTHQTLAADEAERKKMSLRLHDDIGQGFAVDGKTSATKNNRLGLLGMRERVEMIGGTFCVDSAVGRGTTIRVEIPSQRQKAAHPAPPLSGVTTSLECP